MAARTPRQTATRTAGILPVIARMPAGSRRYVRTLASLAAALVAVCSTRAYDLIGSSWADGNIVIHLQLGTPPAPLIDGATDWNAVAESALNDWNQHLTRVTFTTVRGSNANVARRNGVNNVAFRTSIYGSAFDSRTLAVTLGENNPITGRAAERDVLFNANRTWNSYRGSLRGGLAEFRRTALHEFGHVLGLDHPDEAIPRQNVVAIMNSTVSNVETLRDDDIAGARALYDASSGGSPTILAQPQSKTLQVGDTYTLAVTVAGNGPFRYHWSYQAPDASQAERFWIANRASYTFGSVQIADSGTYRVAVETPGGGLVESSPAVLNGTPIPTSPDTNLINISTRGVIGSDTGVMIVGFVISGSSAKDVFVRAAGPALRDFGVSDALTDPTLTIVDSQSRTIAQNDNWETGTNDPAEIEATRQRLGAFAFPPGSRDAALLLRGLLPGLYSAIVRGVNNGTGIALVEAYDADPDPATARSRPLVNISTRGRVESGDNVLIAGLVVAGPGPRTYLIRAVGPTLWKDFGVNNALLDPFLEIYQGENLLRENDDWDSPSAAQPALREAAQKVGAFALMEGRDDTLRTGLDAAMLVTLQPGSYTAKVSGFEGATGIGLIEIYEMP